MADSQLLEQVNQEEDTQKGKFLTFNLGNESYGIEIKYVIEIIGIQPITEVPELPEYIRGIVNLRGKIIPVMDVRLRFKKAFKAYNERTCIVVMDTGDLCVGLIVDSVAEVISIDDDKIVPPPNTSTNVQNKYIKGIGKVGDQVKLLLDCNKLLLNEIVEELSEIEQ